MRNIADLQNRKTKLSLQSVPEPSGELVFHLGPETDAVCHVALALETFLIDFRPVACSNEKLSRVQLQDCLYNLLDRLEELSKQAHAAFSLVLNEHYVEEDPPDPTPSFSGECA